MNRFKTLISVSFVFSFIFTLTFLMVSHPTSTQAASLENFDAGYIISDYQMGNYTSMTVEEIQSFLDSKNSCSKSAKSGRNPHYYLDNKLTQEISSDQLSTVSDYYIYSEYWSNSLGKYIYVVHHIRDGKFVCLNNELFTTTDEYGSGRTAAEIIYEASQTYQINPQVLLALLEKEEGLITDAWPNNIQYRSATGYGCPDTAKCSSLYYGLENQVKNAAALFRSVLDGGWTNYPLGDNYIKYNPSDSCGGSTVNVKNLATSALYRYTPYQPNAATIAAGYGSGITCGAYGNRNFYLYFNDWFGSSISEQPEQSLEPLGEISIKSTSIEDGITKYWQSIGAEKSILGKVTGSITYGLTRGGAYQSFEYGNIYWTPNSEAWEVSGGIMSRYYDTGAEWGTLGYPTGAEVRGLTRGGAYQSFEYGNIYWTPNSEAWEVSGDFIQAYYDQNNEWGILGYPISSQKTNETDKYQKFENGTLYYDNQDFWLIANFALDAWIKIGDTTSKLGQTKHSSVCGLVNDGCYQGFETGVIIGTESTGYWDVSGGIYSAWVAEGSEWGSLGYPTSSEIVEKNYVYQNFENGTITWKNSKATVSHK